jgi:hypothetical protein
MNFRCDIISLPLYNEIERTIYVRIGGRMNDFYHACMFIVYYLSDRPLSAILIISLNWFVRSLY